MTLDDLIKNLKRLRKLPEVGGDAEVVLATDPDGNGYWPLVEVEEGAWDIFKQEFGFTHLDDDLRELGFDENDVVDGVPAVCLWPGHPRQQQAGEGKAHG